MDVLQRIAEELSVQIRQVAAAVTLIDDGATVPFIARYRKEATGGLDDAQLRTLEERLVYLRELNMRRETILDSIRAQEKLTPSLEKAILNADTKTVLEDLYLPYKPKRRTKAQIAREAGLEPLADSLLQNRNVDPVDAALAYIDADKGIADAEAALEGARQILMERISEDADLLAELRERVWNRGVVRASVVAGMEQQGAKFSDYFDYSEEIRKIPSHRALALLRARNEGVLNLTLTVSSDPEKDEALCEAIVGNRLAIGTNDRPTEKWLRDTVHFAWKVKLFTRIDLDLKTRLREHAEAEAIRVFAENLRDLLLAAPAGPRATLGLDPGLRTGVKVAVVDRTGKLLETATIFPHAPQRKWDEAIAILESLVNKHGVDLVSIGNGTASRETDQLVSALVKRIGEGRISKLTVSEAGASVYSASELASKEFPDIDVSLRGAVSIARRLQDPLAELVKIDPKSIGVGQYQHDVNQARLARSLDAVVEDCVNAVGVDVNTASVSLLKRVSGLSAAVGQNIVDFRNANGPFIERRQLLKVPRLGDKAFEQAAGFLRINDGLNPLDASAVHPEAYPVVEKIMQDTGKRIDEMVGQIGFLRQLDPGRYTDARFGVPTVNDILSELEKPGRDPRPEFKSAQFKPDIEAISDLYPGMSLEGVVTNVTNFGAFVDVGVHQDGLVHISQMADRFVKDPRDIVKTGDVVNVKVLEIDIPRRRISLTMRTDSSPETARKESEPRRKSESRKPRRASAPQGAMAEALARAMKK